MRLRTLLLVLPLCTVAQITSAQQGGTAAVRSPEVAADRRVTFRVAAPKAIAPGPEIAGID